MPHIASRRRHRGFTLIELIVAITILAILSAVIVPEVLTRVADARRATAKADVATLMQALKLYKIDNGRFPTAEQGLQALVTQPTTGPIPGNWKRYIDKLPADPWKNPYQYDNPGLKGEIDVYSLGDDKAPGGEGGAADIGSWD